jgi:hypothetical protein
MVTSLVKGLHKSLYLIYQVISKDIYIYIYIFMGKSYSTEHDRQVKCINIIFNMRSHS